MNKLSLIRRNLLHFRAANLAVVAGMAVATAVLTGALMVGDSVRGSLRDQVALRLGPVDYAITSSQFFKDTFGTRLAQGKFTGRFDLPVPAISVRGGAVDSARKTSTGGVQIAAIGSDEPRWLPVNRGECVLNGELADSLNASVGDEVRLKLPQLDEASRDATLGRRERSETTVDLTARVARIESKPGFASMFSLAPSQRLPRNAWVNLADLQSAIGQRGRANVLLVHEREATNAARGGAYAAGLNESLNEALAAAVDLDDAGLKVAPAGGGREASLTSTQTYLPRPVVAAAEAACKSVAVRPREVSAYLVNTVTRHPQAGGAAGDSIHYAMAAGVSSLDDGSAIADDQVVLNQWAVDHLHAAVGDSIDLTYYLRLPNGELREVRGDRPGVGMTFRVGRILPMSGDGADPSLTPAFKGLTDKGSISSWEAPKGVDIKKEWVTKDDEAYWMQHKAAPKLFVSLDAAKKLWGTPLGEITSVRVPADKAGAFASALRQHLDPAAVGMAFVPIRQQQLDASSGGTDFGMFFVYFSFFIIAAAVLLVAMLFRLSVEQRARQLGLLAAVGFAAKSLRRMALAEGLVLAVVGGIVGTFGAIGYTALMMAGLRTWWVGAVGTKMLTLHVEPMTLMIGFVSSVFIAALAVLWGVWRVGKASPSRLLAGAWGVESVAVKKPGKWSARVGLASLAGGLAMIGLGVGGKMSNEEAFLGGGTLLLIACLCLLGARLRSTRRRGQAVGLHSVAGLGVRNAGRHPARSVLTVGLIAFAAFTLVTVAAMRQPSQADARRRASGTGGYDLLLQADIPLMGDLGTREGRELLGIGDDLSRDPLWQRTTFTPLRTWAGQDISCLNLTKPNSPNIVAASPALVARKPFTFSGTVRKVDDPWTLLDGEAEGGGIPVIADGETAEYVLGLKLGGSMSITDQTGTPRKLVLVATLEGNIFQSQLLMGEANFQRLFPSQSGFGLVLIESQPADTARLRQLLPSELDDYAVTVDSTVERLAMYKQVQNTYLSTFQTLGSLGLLLGTIGLAVVLLRGLVERQSELAMLAAIGFRRLDRLRLVLAENAYLLVLGLAVGTVCALVAVLPALRSARHLQLGGLAVTLGAVLAVGLAALTAAVWVGGRRITPADLNRE